MRRRGWLSTADAAAARCGRREFLAHLAAPALAAACDVRAYARAHGAKLRLSVATGPVGGVYYIYGGAIAKIVSAHVPNVEATAEVTGASGDNLRFLRDSRVDLALVTGDALADARAGRGRFASFGKVPAVTIATLYAQPLHIATFERTGIRSLADLRGRVVATGSPGSGTEEMVFRILRSLGLDPDRDVARQGLGVGAAAEALKDGKIDALCWSSGFPAGAILDLANTQGERLRLIPSAGALPALQRDHGAALYFELVIPRSAYPGLAADVPTVGVATVLVADERMEAGLAYEVTRTLFDHRDELIAVHEIGRELTPASAVARSPVPYHAGAIRFYRERGAWPG